MDDITNLPIDELIKIYENLPQKTRLDKLEKVICKNTIEILSSGELLKQLLLLINTLLDMQKYLIEKIK